MMQGDQAVLHVGSRAEFGRRPQQDAHLSGAHAGEQFRFLRFRRGFMDKSDFLFGDAHLNQFIAHIIVDIEMAVSLGRGQIAKDQLGRPFFYAALPDGKGVPHAGVDLAALIVWKHFLHQPLIQRAFPAVIGNTQHIVYGGGNRAAAHPVRAFREGRYIFPLDFAGLQGDIHKLRFRDRQRQHIRRLNIRCLLEYGNQFRQVEEPGEARPGAVAGAFRGQFYRGYSIAKRRRPGIEMPHAHALQR